MSTTYGFTNKYLTKDEKPWFPVMGEILGDMSGGVRKYGSEWKENFRI